MSEVRRTMRRTAVAAVVTAVAATTVCVGGGTAGAAGERELTKETVAGAEQVSRLQVTGRFAPPRAAIPSAALSYRQDLVPAAARITVSQTATEQGTRVGVAVSGVKARHRFGVHVHTRPCGTKPDASGPHYQHRQDPVQPSTDPAYANPRNEVWLDLRTDGRGSGEATARQRWGFRAGGAQSIVLHERATHSGHGKAGQAGDRVACFSVPFEGGQGV